MRAQQNRPAISRREFGRLAVAAGAALVPAATGTGAAAHSAGHTPHSRAQNAPDAALQKLSPEGRARFETMWQNVLRAHGDRFSDGQKARLRRIVLSNAAMLEAVYAVDVKNGDGPATILRLVGGGAPSQQGAANAKTRRPAARRR